jgi:hypothetical protein
MKKALPLFISILALTLFSCSHKYYASSLFDQQTAHHKIVAVLPAQMVYSGRQPENLSNDDIANIEEEESKKFQLALFNSILRHANTRKYFTRVNLQDIALTQKLLDEHNISAREVWKKDDKELTAILGVDAVVRLRIQKQRYMSDLASYGIVAGRNMIYHAGLKIPVPYVSNKTNDIYASCDIISNNQTLWNDSYKGVSDWNTPSNAVIENIADNFGQHFPYKEKR